MKTTLPIAVVLLVSTLFIACSKDQSLTDTNTELLTKKSWKFEAYGLDENNNGVIDAGENNMMSCETDDFFTFNKDGSGYFLTGDAECTPGEPAVTNFTWTLSNNGTELAIFAAPEKISRLDDTVLEVYYMDQNSQGQDVKFIRRFNH